MPEKYTEEAITFQGKAACHNESESSANLEALIGRMRKGEAPAIEELAEVTYLRLWTIASRIIGTTNGNPSLGPTALVNEGFVKLLTQQGLEQVTNVEHFFSLFARAMRQIFIDYHRQKKSAKRGGGKKRLDLDIVLNYVSENTGDVEAVSEAIEKMKVELPRAAGILEMQFFAFMKIAEICAVTDLSRSTVENDLRLAKAFVKAEMT